MSKSKRALFGEIYDEQKEVLELIDKPLRLKDLKGFAVGLNGKFDFKMIATNNFGNNNYKCLCPQCKSWLDEWKNWYDAKEFDADLKAVCKSCGCVCEGEDMICEAVKKK